jgi:hypothetical protein
MLEDYRRMTNRDFGGQTWCVQDLRPEVGKDHYANLALEYEKKCLFRAAGTMWRMQGWWAKHHQKSPKKFEERSKKCFTRFFRVLPLLKLVDLDQGVGFNKKGFYHVHRFYEATINTKNDWFEKAKSLLPSDFHYDLVAIQAASISFLKVSNFDTDLRPIVEETLKVLSSSKTRHIVHVHGDQVIQDKWLYIKEDYPGFDYFQYVHQYMEEKEVVSPSEPKKTVYLYALMDPREPDIVRYIGKTDNISRRLSEHIAGSRNEEAITPKDLWIKGLLKAGVSPEIKLVETVVWRYDPEWADREMACIEKYRREGHPLTNKALGGNMILDFDQVIRIRKFLWEENPTPDNEFKYHLFELLRGVNFIFPKTEKKAGALFKNNTSPSRL